MTDSGKNESERESDRLMAEQVANQRRIAAQTKAIINFMRAHGFWR